MEEPMDEHSMSSYVWLCERTSLAICGPETVEGKMFSRAEWIKAGACDIVRAGVGDVGGLTPLMKILHLAEAFGMQCEVHGGGVGNLHAMCAVAELAVLRARPATPVHRLRHAAALAQPP